MDVNLDEFVSILWDSHIFLLTTTSPSLLFGQFPQFSSMAQRPDPVPVFLFKLQQDLP
jgi:hypothetical protein